MSSPTTKSVRFSDNFIKGLKPAEKRYDVFDGRGLGVRVTPKGTKTFVLVYRFNNKPKMLTIGTYPAYSLADANRKNLEAKEALARGEDPAIERPKAGADITVEELCKEFLAKHSVNLAARTKSDYEKELAAHVIPRIGSLPVRSVRRGDGIMLLDDMVAAGQRSAANRVKAYLSKIWNWGLDRNLVDEMPFYRLPKPTVTKSRKRALSEDEIARFWLRLPVIKSRRTVAALRLCLLLGRRETEVVGAKWNEFDLEAGIWTIPTDRPGRKLRERTRANADPLVIPLPPLAIEILKELRASQSMWDFVFPSEKEPALEHHSVGALSHALVRRKKEMGFDENPVAPHDLRRTASTHMARLGVRQEIIDKVLDHKADIGISAVYNQHAYVEQRRSALLLWNDEIQRLLERDKEKWQIKVVKKRKTRKPQ